MGMSEQMDQTMIEALDASQRTISEAKLATLLRAASEAHHEHEKKLGYADALWPEWYARFVMEHLPQGESFTDGAGI